MDNSAYGEGAARRSADHVTEGIGPSAEAATTLQTREATRWRRHAGSGASPVACRPLRQAPCPLVDAPLSDGTGRTEEVSKNAVAALFDTSEVASLRATIPYRLSPVTATDRSKEDVATSRRSRHVLTRQQCASPCSVGVSWSPSHAKRSRSSSSAPATASNRLAGITQSCANRAAQSERGSA